MSGEMSVAKVLLGFCKVIVNVDSSHISIELGLKDLVSVGKSGAGITASVAAAGNALLPLEVTKEPAGIVFTKLPAFCARTTKLMVQLPEAGITAAPLKVTVTGVIFGAEPVTLPPQVVLGLPMSVRPAGKVSTKFVVKAAGSTLLLIKVIVTLERSPAVIEKGAKLLLIRGVVISGDMTVKVAAAGAAFAPSLVCKTPAAMEFI